jgi:hypothetical protein
MRPPKSPFRLLLSLLYRHCRPLLNRREHTGRSTSATMISVRTISPIVFLVCRCIPSIPPTGRGGRQLEMPCQPRGSTKRGSIKCC